MLTGIADPACRTKLEQELSRHPTFTRVLGAVRESVETFTIDPRSEGLEFVLLHGSEPSRCRMKLFRPREEKERLCAFFFKKSNLAGSRDRFSYGAVEFLPERLKEEEIRPWIAWLGSGLDPSLRPEHLKRAFLYTIPE